MFYKEFLSNAIVDVLFPGLLQLSLMLDWLFGLGCVEE
jgi:hypothetical protein